MDGSRTERYDRVRDMSIGHKIIGRYAGYYHSGSMEAVFPAQSSNVALRITFWTKTSATQSPQGVGQIEKTHEAQVAT